MKSGGHSSSRKLHPMKSFQNKLVKIEANDGYADVSEHSFYKHLKPSLGPLSIHKFKKLKVAKRDKLEADHVLTPRSNIEDVGLSDFGLD